MELIQACTAWCLRHHPSFKAQLNPVITPLKGLNALCVVISEEFNVMVNIEELIGTAEYLTL